MNLSYLHRRERTRFPNQTGVLFCQNKCKKLEIQEKKQQKTPPSYTRQDITFATSGVCGTMAKPAVLFLTLINHFLSFDRLFFVGFYVIEPNFDEKTDATRIYEFDA
jgi:hypothetical protein